MTARHGDRTNARRFVAVIDDDESVRESLPGLLTLLGYDAEAFESGGEFLASGALNHADCLIVDVAMPGISGPELMRHPAVRARAVPIVFITALQDESVRQELLRQGASGCLFKPFGETALLEALARALAGP